jgi:hypothetical protein
MVTVVVALVALVVAGLVVAAQVLSRGDLFAYCGFLFAGVVLVGDVVGLLIL